ncbi:MAG: hypothetical protein ACTSPI_11745 [Candidatus Heimdallarchaeaceae archaeon]
MDIAHSSIKQNNTQTPFRTTVRNLLHSYGIKVNGILIKVNGKIVYDLDLEIRSTDDVKILYSLKENKRKEIERITHNLRWLDPHL